MEKQQAIEMIKELEDRIAELKAIVDRPDKNVVTQWPTADNKGIYINGRWVANLYPEEEQGVGYPYNKTGREASLFLGYAEGSWYNDQGEQVKGYLYYEPEK